MLRLSLALALLAGAPQAADKKQDAADAAVRKLLEKEKVHAGGIVRCFRFPAPVPKGWSVVEAMAEENPKGLEAKEPSYLYFLDRKAGPNYSHAVDYLLVTAAKADVSRIEAGWMPEVRDDKGRKVEKVGGKDPGEWWLGPAGRIAGDEGPSIQAAQDAVKFKYMMGAMPAGATSMVLYSCPATLPAGGSITVQREGKSVKIAAAENESFVIFANYGPRDAFPHPGKVVVYDRKTKKEADFDVEEEPALLDAKGGAIACDDGGKALGAWYADDAHSFMARMSFGGK